MAAEGERAARLARRDAAGATPMALALDRRRTETPLALTGADPREWRRGQGLAGAPCGAAQRRSAVRDGARRARRRRGRRRSTGYSPLHYAVAHWSLPMARARARQTGRDAAGHAGAGVRWRIVAVTGCAAAHCCVAVCRRARSWTSSGATPARAAAATGLARRRRIRGWYARRCCAWCCSGGRVVLAVVCRHGRGQRRRTVQGSRR